MYDLKPLAKRVASSVLNRLPLKMRSRVKKQFELRYGKELHQNIYAMPSEQREAKFIHERANYEYFYTVFFGLDLTHYDGKKILDIGCGPMGSLEWADQASIRIGLDPLANDYRSIGAASHNMGYVAAASEYIPFADEMFDFVTSVNSLDHGSGRGADRWRDETRNGDVRDNLDHYRDPPYSDTHRAAPSGSICDRLVFPRVYGRVRPRVRYPRP